MARSLHSSRSFQDLEGGLRTANSAIEWSFLRRRRSHMGEGLCLLNGEGLLFRVPLAKPGGTLDLPFGSFASRWRSQRERSACLSDPSPLQGIGPRSLTPPLAHSSPRSSRGSNAPHPLAGDWAAMPVMKIHGDLHCPFAFHRGIGVGPGHCFSPDPCHHGAKHRCSGEREGRFSAAGILRRKWGPWTKRNCWFW